MARKSALALLTKWEWKAALKGMTVLKGKINFTGITEKEKAA